MAELVTIGEFSRLTHLSVKALRHYHKVGLLVPAEVDPWSGYRRYSTDQAPEAQLVRRLRELDMPVPEVRALLQAGPGGRQETLAQHLQRMESELERTRSVVGSLRALLEDPTVTLPIELRSVPAVPAYVIQRRAEREHIGEWCAKVFAELDQMVAAAGVEPKGPGGVFYPPDWFEDDTSDLLAYIPVGDGEGASSRPVDAGRAPGGDFAVVLHLGSYEDLDRTYTALGTYVAERGIGTTGPIRESYLVSPGDTDDPNEWRTEIGWPIRPNSPTA